MPRATLSISSRPAGTYRLKAVEIHVPPLRERNGDVPVLANCFIAKNSLKLGKKIEGLTTPALGALLCYGWPGDVRDLENVVQRMIILSETELLDVDVLPSELVKSAESLPKALDRMAPQSLDEIEMFLFPKTLRETKGNRALAAEILGIDKATLWQKIRRYNREAETGAEHAERFPDASKLQVQQETRRAASGIACRKTVPVGTVGGRLG